MGSEVGIYGRTPELGRFTVKDRAWLPVSRGEGLGPNVIKLECSGWNIAVRHSWGQGLATGTPQGTYKQCYKH